MLLAGHDVLRDEGVAYAARLAEAGVPVETEIHEDMIHVFFSMTNVPRAVALIERAGRWLAARR